MIKSDYDVKKSEFIQQLQTGCREYLIEVGRLKKYDLSNFSNKELSVFEQVKPWSSIQQEALESKLINDFSLKKKTGSSRLENLVSEVGYQDYKDGRFWVYCANSFSIKNIVKKILSECWRLEGVYSGIK